MKIGELAKASGTTVKTIRYYESIEVLPEPDRRASGYREYDQDALDRLAFIKAAQGVGLRLGEIREIVAFRDRGETPCAHVLDLIQQRAQEFAERIRQLQRLRRDLAGLADRGRHLDPRDCEPSAVCHIIRAE